MSKPLYERDWLTIQAALLLSPYAETATNVYPFGLNKAAQHIITRNWIVERLQAFDELRYKLHQTNNIKRRAHEKRQR